MNMKKLLLYSSLILGLLLISLAIFAQDTIPVPDDIVDVVVNLNTYFGSFLGLAVLATFLAAFMNGILKVTSKWIRQLVAWGVAIILMLISALANFGFASEFPILQALVYGLGVGLVANGVFDVPVVKAILDKVEGWFKPKTT
jgi:hypothetical protein